MILLIKSVIKNRKLFFFFFLILCSANIFGQKITSDKGYSFSAVDERKIVETKWRYTYALHLESNTIIHQAEENYDFYLHFRYDYTYEQYLNGRMTKGTWSLNGRDLFYRFKHINKFVIADINKKSLTLEFNQPNSKGTYQYHFIRVESKDAPFVKPANELPDVNVEALHPNKKKRNWLAFGKRKNKKKAKRKKAPEEKETYISIELIGGGYYGGIDPVIRDYIQIKSNGRLIKEFKSLQNGLIVTKKDIPREELEAFAEFVVSQNFFEFERIYDCETSLCLKRKKMKPTPIPLRLVIAYGTRKKVITISIWGRDRNSVRYVNYPPALDKIIEAIQKMAHRIDQS
ncbi:MAG TPA: hypothetical protein ENK52_03495 [Saprospiraceae bacterium]|nr:hypothetical protein [Saprospiraceae bacterium]